MAYSSARPLNRTAQTDRLFQLDPIDRVYPLFGDSSVRHEYAQSNSRLYARLDRGLSHILFGDIRGDRADERETGLADAMRSLTGVKVHLQSQQRGSLTLRGARPDTSFARDVFPGNTFGMVRLSAPSILQGSETVTLEVRDRRNPERVLSRETLIRNADYNLDAVTGGLFFLRPIQALDQALNLTQIVVTYEFRGKGRKSDFYTARGQTEFSRFGLKLGGSYLTQRQSGDTFQLGSVDIEQRLPNRGRLLLETPVSRGRIALPGSFYDDAGTDQRNGVAVRAEIEQPLALSARAFQSAILRATLTKTAAGFLNPFGATVVPGSQRATGEFEFKPLAASSVKLGFMDERNRTSNVDNSRQTASGLWSWNLREQVDLLAGYDFRHLQDVRANTDVRSHLVTAGVDWRATSRLMLGARREQNLAEADPTYPSQTLLLGKYKWNDFSRLFFTQRLAQAPINPIADLSGTGFASIQSKRETTFGVETRLKRLATISTRYQMENGINGTDSFAVIGLLNRVPVNRALAVDFGIERGFLVDGNSGNFISTVLGLSWQPRDNFRASSRYELRDRNGFGNVVTAGAAGRLSEGVTTLGSLQLFRSDFSGQRTSGLLATVALAVRPLRSDRAGVLVSLTHRDMNGQGSWRALSPSERSTVLSSDGYWQAVRRVEFFGRFALSNRGSTQAVGDPLSTVNLLWQGRSQLRLTRYLDIAAEARTIFQPSTATRRNSSGVEIGGWILPDLRAGLGYSFRSTADTRNTFLLYVPESGWYFTLSTKLSNLFDLFGTRPDRQGQQAVKAQKSQQPRAKKTNPSQSAMGREGTGR